jgi:hypothetical protein
MIYFSPPSNKAEGFVLMLIGCAGCLMFYYFYGYKTLLWRRIPVMEAVFSNLGALSGVIVIVAILAIFLLKFQKTK